MSILRPRMGQAIDEIIAINTRINGVWRNVYGWTSSKGADLLSKARLDRQVALSRTLRLWIKKAPKGEQEARLILGWANLGSLVEGTMKFFLCVFAHNYASDYFSVGATKNSPEPDPLMLEQLKQFFRAKVWTPRQQRAWLPFVELVQQRRNAIHAYKDRPVGDLREFRKAVRTYMDFLSEIDGSVPYPEIPA